MPRFKNIRVRMKGGKSRIQRAMVLASGKLKFVKNIGRRTPKKANTTRNRRIRPKTRFGGRNMRRRRFRGHRGGGGKSLVKTAEKFISIGTFAAPPIIKYLESAKWGWGMAERLDYAVIQNFSGFSVIRGKEGFYPQELMTGWGPFVLNKLITAGVHKLAGIIRGL